MISLTTLRNHLDKIFILASPDGMEFYLKYQPKRRVYKITITLTNIPYPRKQWAMAKRMRVKKTKVDMSLQECPNCYAPMVAGVCMHRGCIQSSKIE
jgi:hypothetical protein